MSPETSAQELRARVKSIAQEVVRAHATDVDKNARFPAEALAALKREKLLSVLVPSEFGGADIGMSQVAGICEELAAQCASTGMMFAMHQIQVACIARHAKDSKFFGDYLRDLVEKQRLIASVTSEVGVGGEMRKSVAHVAESAGKFTFKKQATTISYGEYADDLLATSRRGPDAASNDQVLVLLRSGEFQLEKTSVWDTLGMRGTCSPGYDVTSSGPAEAILPTPFDEIASQTMVPVSHVLWSSVWLGIAASAVSIARSYVRQQARAKPGVTPPSAMRLAETYNLLQTMRSTVREVAHEAEDLMQRNANDALSSIAFALKINNLKVSASQLVVEIVHHALQICGIMGYKNDSPFSLGQKLRDAHSAQLMIANDRIYGTNASLLLVLKED